MERADSRWLVLKSAKGRTSTNTTETPFSISCLVSSALIVKLDEGFDPGVADWGLGWVTWGGVTAAAVCKLDEAEAEVGVAVLEQPIVRVKQPKRDKTAIIKLPNFRITIYLKYQLVYAMTRC